MRPMNYVKIPPHCDMKKRRSTVWNEEATSLPSTLQATPTSLPNRTTPVHAANPIWIPRGIRRPNIPQAAKLPFIFPYELNLSYI